MEPEYITRAEAAIIYQVSTRTIDRWMRENDFRPLRVGRSVRLSRRAFDRLVKRIARKAATSDGR